MNRNVPAAESIHLVTNTRINYTLHLADSALIMGHRLSEWTGHGPVLEQDIAISNVALDYIGQARNWYDYAANLINQSTIPSDAAATEDSLAYLRDAMDYKNHLLVELPNGDWAQTVLKICCFSVYQYVLYAQLAQGSDAQIAAIAEKSLKEATYHVRWSSEWVIRLGDGTTESHQRMQNAMEAVWAFTGELCHQPTYDVGLVDYELLQQQWQEKMAAIITTATVTTPTNPWMQTGGHEGKHTEYLGFILAEMQFLQRAYPNATW